jgi:hypothetical protein
MDPVTQLSTMQPPSTNVAARRRGWALAVALVAACGGTTGIQNFVGGGSGISSKDASMAEGSAPETTDRDAPVMDPTPQVDATIDDGPAYDRTVPSRPPPQNTGAPRASDSGQPAAEAGDAGVSSDAPPVTTFSIFANQSPQCARIDYDASGDARVAVQGGCLATNCLDVLNAAGPGVCELLEGGVLQTVANNGSGPTTIAVMDPDFTANCLKTIQDSLGSHCLNSTNQNLTPCLCGDADTNTCLIQGISPPPGPVGSDYVKSFGIMKSSDINNNFNVPKFGAGQANTILQCATSFGCFCCIDDGGVCPP